MTDPYEQSELSEIRERAKRQIRRRMHAVRAALPKSAIAERSHAICETIVALAPFERARSVALFWPITARGEVDLRDVDTAARRAGKRVYYPFMEIRDAESRVVHTGFRLVGDVMSLADRGRGFHEPASDAREAVRADIDLIVVPALAVAADGHRIGYGAGFYDATLPEHCPPALSVAAAFDFQLLAELPVGSDDFACDIVVTDRHTLDVRGVLP